VKYAVVESGGKQYIARPGELIEVDHMPLEIGKAVKFTHVLMAVDGSAIHVGQPMVKGAVVEGEVVGQIKGRKIIVFKYKPRIRYRRKQGHRQRYTQVSIQKITLPADKAAAAPASAAKQSDAAAKPAASKDAPKKAAPAKKKPAATPAKKTTTTTQASKPAAKKPASKASTKKTADEKASSKPAAKKTTSSKKADEK